MDDLEQCESCWFVQSLYCCASRVLENGASGWLDENEMVLQLQMGANAHKLLLQLQVVFDVDDVVVFSGVIMKMVTDQQDSEEHAVTCRSATAKSVSQWIVKPQTTVKLNEMFLPGRMSFIFNMVPYSGSWNYNINGVKHNTNLTCGIKLGSMVTLRTSARLVG
ncbi:hypothetical protein MKW92_018275 [Papaver armeniacum]|nr:hypothetical protein MKW92_018275 [Papaver armeniacum]